MASRTRLASSRQSLSTPLPVHKRARIGCGSSSPRISGTFPTGILAVLCASLSRCDLKNLRLLSHAWDEAAQQILFETVYLRINLESFERLRDIAEHPKLSRHVQVVSYDGRTLGSRAARQGFQSWLEFSAGAGLGMVWEAKDEFLAQFSEEDLAKYYYDYCQHLFAQDHILRRGNEKELLVGALQKLPNLSEVQYTVKSRVETGLSLEPPLLSSLGPVARQILAEPEDYHGYLTCEGHFWTLLQSACLSGHAQQLRRVGGSHLDLERWNAKAASLVDCYAALPALRHLSLEFEFAQHGDGETTHLASMVKHASSLTSLRLSFDEFSWDDPSAVIHLPHIMDDKTHWARLQRLSLQAVVTTEGYFRNLLERHSQTLRLLELSNVNFKAATVAGQRVRGSWICFIQFLREKMSLEHVRFDGCFSNNWDEGWVTGDAKEDWEGASGIRKVLTPYSEDCLKYRIERFITHGGTCPFIARKAGVDGELYDASYCYNRLPWIFKHDRSWSFEERLLQ